MKSPGRKTHVERHMETEGKMRRKRRKRRKRKTKEKLQGVGRFDFMSIIDYQVQSLGLST